jgi:hypothetical protein
MKTFVKVLCELLEISQAIFAVIGLLVVLAWLIKSLE